MSQKLKGKSAVVTGGGSGGMGRGIALALAAEGAMVVVNDIGRSTDGKNIADDVVEEIVKANGKAVANYDSVATMEGGANIIKTAVSSFGHFDILVNCAGNFMVAPGFEITEEQWDSIMSVHLKGHFNCIKAAVPEMTKQKSGRIINFSSRASFVGSSSVNFAYGVAKAGVLSLTTALSDELKEQGITVNAILPSAVTKLFKGLPPMTPGENLPTPQILEPDYVAPMIVYLATNEAQDITGRFIHVSGGDICIYPRPLYLSGGAPKFIRKLGKWTIDELDQVVPSVLGLPDKKEK